MLMNVTLEVRVPNDKMGHNLAQFMTDELGKWGKAHSENLSYSITLENTINEKV